ncbi:hypothetical protein A2U01_0097007, partial [Trifolium medium]|nr:hypothetical protein [Trifolium medium]
MFPKHNSSIKELHRHHIELNAK